MNTDDSCISNFIWLTLFCGTSHWGPNNVPGHYMGKKWFIIFFVSCALCLSISHTHLKHTHQYIFMSSLHHAHAFKKKMFWICHCLDLYIQLYMTYFVLWITKDDGKSVGSNHSLSLYGEKKVVFVVHWRKLVQVWNDMRVNKLNRPFCKM